MPLFDDLFGSTIKQSFHGFEFQGGLHASYDAQMFGSGALHVDAGCAYAGSGIFDQAFCVIDMTNLRRYVGRICGHSFSRTCGLAR